jgi:hypothetical protein
VKKISSFLPGFAAVLFPIILPITHIFILWYFWHAYARWTYYYEPLRSKIKWSFHCRFYRFVDKRFCSCSCWDTVFKATYESGIASYKHVYFNSTLNTMQIWLLTVVFIISLYEAMKYLTKLIISKQLRYSMAFLFCLSIFSHYYAWWSYLNYINDDFYSQWNHQTFFTVSIPCAKYSMQLLFSNYLTLQQMTEFFSTAFVLHLANRENVVTSRKWV